MDSKRKNVNQVINYYRSEIERNKAGVAKILNQKRRILVIRALSFLFAILSLFFFDFWQNAGISFLFLSIFTFAVNRDLRLRKKLDYFNRLLIVFQKELDVTQNNSFFVNKVDKNEEGTHAYTSDLDILGEDSLFHFIDRTVTKFGKETLTEWLKHPADPSEVELRQDAVKEMGANPDDIIELISQIEEQKLEVDINRMVGEFQKQKFSMLKFVVTLCCSGINLSCFFLFFFNVIPFVFFLLIVFFNSALVYEFLWKQQIRTVKNLEISSKELARYAELLKLIERTDFKTELLQKIRLQFSEKNDQVSTCIHKLSVYNKRFDYRLNLVFHMCVNAIIYFDIIQFKFFDAWIKENSNKIKNWFDTLGKFEALVCLSNLSFKNPDWTFPDVENNTDELYLENAGHPLIHRDKRVVNSFGIELDGNFKIITGSNMAGKSTFLRTVGINIVLALSGGPVCATKAIIPSVKLYTSMRIKDSLSENTSTFQAELERVKSILKLSELGQKLFVLLDEPLRGTNSEDRFLGVSALVKQLISNKTSGILATHDLRLTTAFQYLPRKVSNYHFDISVVNQDYAFDYKLKEGVCKTFNASLLLKKIGLDLDSE